MLLLVACSAGMPAQRAPTLVRAQDAVTGLLLPTGYRAELVADRLNQPTHIAWADDGTLYATQLNGDENAGNGQVVRLVSGQPPEVILDGVLKPTGLTWAGATLYIAARERVLATELQPDGSLSPPRPVTDPLPYNGRSNGQIMTGPDGLLYFQSTGSELAPDNSGVIYSAKPGLEPLKLEIVARGLKNAYAFAWHPTSGLLYATEIGDGRIAGLGAPPEELNAIQRGGHYGWPRCYDNQKENRERGGERIFCSDTDVPLATFPPQSTPTGLAYFDGSLIVALWGTPQPRLVAVDSGSGAVTDFATGFVQPVALRVSPDGRQLLVVDIGGGKIYRVSRS
jgi:glucose/arabinose dehydrogenase